MVLVEVRLCAEVAVEDSVVLEGGESDGEPSRHVDLFELVFDLFDDV